MTALTLGQSHIVHRFIDRIRSNERRHLLRVLHQNAVWVEEVYSAPTLASWTEELARGCDQSRAVGR
jgi:hypothetical protein